MTGGRCMQGQFLPAYILGGQKTFFPFETFCPKMHNLVTKNIWVKFRGKIKTLSTHNLLSEICSNLFEFCRKFGVSVKKLQLTAQPTF